MNRILTTIVLAAPQPGDYDPSTGKGSEWGKAAPIGLLVILLLGIATFFLLRSFTRQLKKVPATFDEVEPAVPVGAAGVIGAAGAGPAGSAGADAPAGAATGDGDGDSGAVRVPAADDDGTAARRAGSDEPAG